MHWEVTQPCTSVTRHGTRRPELKLVAMARHPSVVTSCNVRCVHIRFIGSANGLKDEEV